MNLYKVTLGREEREQLQQITQKGKHQSQRILNALILLNCDQGTFQDQPRTNEEVAAVLRISKRKIDRVKRRFVEQGLEAALNKQKGERVYKKKADGDVEAHLLALSCSKPPEDSRRWTLRMLADQVVELNYVDSISYETVRRVLKKTKPSPGKRSVG